jgi:hypothetical protein
LEEVLGVSSNVNGSADNSNSNKKNSSSDSVIKDREMALPNSGNSAEENSQAPLVEEKIGSRLVK